MSNMPITPELTYRHGGRRMGWQKRNSSARSCDLKYRCERSTADVRIIKLRGSGCHTRRAPQTEIADLNLT
jgi:hypothetical protein